MSTLWLPSRRTQQPQIAVPANAGGPLAKGLIGLYPGNGLRNASRAAYGDAVASAPFPTVSTLKGRALAFDGTRYVSFGPAIQWFTGANECAACYWIYPTSLANAYTALLSFSPSGNNYINLFLKSNGKLAYYVSASASASNYDGSGLNTIATGAWSHICQTYSKSGPCTVYVNGILDASIVKPANYLSETATNLEFGRDAFTSGRIYSGYMLGLSLYSRRLIADEQMALYRNPWQLFADDLLPLPLTAAALYPTLSNIRFAPATPTGGTFAVDLS